MLTLIHESKKRKKITKKINVDINPNNVNINFQKIQKCKHL